MAFLDPKLKLSLFTADVPGVGLARPCVNVHNLLMAFTSSRYGRPEDSEDTPSKAKSNAKSAWKRHQDKPMFQNARTAYFPLTQRVGPALVQYGQVVALLGCFINSAGEDLCTGG